MSEQSKETSVSRERKQQRAAVNREHETRLQANKAASFVWTIFGIIIGLISLRVLLKLIAANPENPFAQFIYNLTEVFVWPFLGLTATPSANGVVLEIPAIVAILVYALAGWAIVKLLWLAIYKPK